MSRKSGGRKKSTGTLERHGRCWRARWIVDGKVYTRTTGTSSKREALELLNEFTEPFQAKNDREKLEGLAAKVKSEDQTILNYTAALPALPLLAGFTAFRRTDKGKRASDATAYMYECQYGKFTDWCKATHPEIRELRQITRKIAREFSEYIQAQSSPNTYNKYLTLLSAVWNALIRHEQSEVDEDEINIPTPEEAMQLARLTINPWADIDKAPVAGSKTSKRALTLEELITVANHVTGEMKTLFALGFYTGQRLKDCCLLDWGCVDLHMRRITFTPSKTKNSTGATSLVPIHNGLLTLLRDTPAENRHGYVLPESAAQYLQNDSEFDKRVNAIFEECGIARQVRQGENRAKCIVGFHSLRHTFVSLTANSGAPIEVIQSIVGHGNPAMTRHYLHADDNALKKAIDVLPIMSKTATTPQNTEHLEMFKESVRNMTPQEMDAAIAYLQQARQQHPLLTMS